VSAFNEALEALDALQSLDETASGGA
jgi:hypothetical protein